MTLILKPDGEGQCASGKVMESVAVALIVRAYLDTDPGRDGAKRPSPSCIIFGFGGLGLLEGVERGGAHLEQQYQLHF